MIRAVDIRPTQEREFLPADFRPSEPAEEGPITDPTTVRVRCYTHEHTQGVDPKDVALRIRHEVVSALENVGTDDAHAVAARIYRRIAHPLEDARNPGPDYVPLDGEGAERTDDGAVERAPAGDAVGAGADGDITASVQRLAEDGIPLPEPRETPEKPHVLSAPGPALEPDGVLAILMKKSWMGQGGSSEDDEDGEDVGGFRPNRRPAKKNGPGGHAQKEHKPRGRKPHHHSYERR